MPRGAARARNERRDLLTPHVCRTVGGCARGIAPGTETALFQTWLKSRDEIGAILVPRERAARCRQVNKPLSRIAMVRLAWHQPTRDYMARRIGQSLSKRDVVRCFKRYVAREVYRALVRAVQLATAA